MANKKSNKKDNTYGIVGYAKLRQQQTFEKVDKAIEKLKRSKTKNINFKTVSEEAGVTTATLYNNEQIKERIMGLKELQEKKKAEMNENTSTATKKQKTDQIKRMREQIKKLEVDKKNLIIQLVEMEELKAEVKKLREKEKKVTPIIDK